MDLLFLAGSDFVNVKLVGKKIYFKKIVNGVPTLQDISKIKLPIEGILSKFPDLKGKEDSEIKRIGSERLKEHIANLNTIEERKLYVIKELESIGCKLISIVKQGHRPIIISKNLVRKRDGLN